MCRLSSRIRRAISSNGLHERGFWSGELPRLYASPPPKSSPIIAIVSVYRTVLICGFSGRGRMKKVSAEPRSSRRRIRRPSKQQSTDRVFPISPADRIRSLGGDPSFMTSLARGLSVIEAFSGDGARPTIAALSSRTGLSRAAVHRCLYTLRRLGFVDTDDERHFFLRPSVLALGYSYLHSSPLAANTQPVLDRLSRQLHESCSIATLEGDSIVYVARSAVNRIMSVDLRIGSRLPAFCTSMGRVLLAGFPPEGIRALVAQLSLTRHTERTIASREKLLHHLQLASREGYAIVDQELEIGLRSIAVPLRNTSGTVVAALNASTHAQRVSLQDMQSRFLPALRKAAQELSLLLETRSFTGAVE